MPKTKLRESALHDWVCDLPFQMQALLMTGIRGADGVLEEHPSKIMVRFIRGAVIKPAGEWNRENNNDFMWGDYSDFEMYSNLFWEHHTELPLHFYEHLVDCAEVIGYKYPDLITRNLWYEFYLRSVRRIHCRQETEWELDRRLNDFGNHKVPSPEGEEWTSVVEPPNHPREVLVTNGADVWIGEYDRNSGWSLIYNGSSPFDSTEITHWMNKPKPPEL